MAKIKGTVTFKIEVCKGCELCIDACPQESLAMSTELNRKGYRYVELVQDNCTGCVNCALVCPDAVITVFRQSKNGQAALAQAGAVNKVSAAGPARA